MGCGGPEAACSRPSGSAASPRMRRLSCKPGWFERLTHIGQHRPLFDRLRSDLGRYRHNLARTRQNFGSCLRVHEQTGVDVLHNPLARPLRCVSGTMMGAFVSSAAANSRRLSKLSFLAPATNLHHRLHCLKTVLFARPSVTRCLPTNALDATWPAAELGS